MRILLNDFSGHPFPLQLGRELACRGYEVLHTWCASFVTPHGSLKREGEPSGFSSKAIRLDGDFNKYGLLSRWRQEREVGRRTVAAVEGFAPQVVISANMPLGAQGVLQAYARRKHVPFVFWLQDLYGEGATRVLRKRIPVFGAVVGRAFALYEQRLLKRSSHIIVITQDFLRFLPRAVRTSRATVIENWAPLDELPVKPKDNDWSREHGLVDKTVFLYAGTLGMKHNPELLLALAQNLRDRAELRVLVISEGVGAGYLKQQKQALRLDNLLVMGFQPFERMPDVLASADVLVTILEKDAGVFAVPSKVLTYLCAERALLLAVPAANLAARIVADAHAGLVAAPDDIAEFVTEARRLAENSALRQSLAANGRRYAERTFDIAKITDRFEAIFSRP